MTIFLCLLVMKNCKSEYGTINWLSLINASSSNYIYIFVHIRDIKFVSDSPSLEARVNFYANSIIVQMEKEINNGNTTIATESGNLLTNLYRFREIDCSIYNDKQTTSTRRN